MASRSRLGGAATDVARRAAAPTLSVVPPPPGAASLPEATSAQSVAIDKITRHPLNPRGRVTADDPAVQELADSMRGGVGVIEPLILTARVEFEQARPGLLPDTPDTVQWVLIAGERRWVAAAIAGLTSVPVRVDDHLVTDGLDVEAMIVENVHRENLTPLQEARAYQSLVDAGHSQRQIANKVGRAQGHVSKRLGLLSLPDTAAEELADGRLAVTDAEMFIRRVKAADRDAVWRSYAARRNHGLHNAITAHEIERERQAQQAKRAAASVKEAKRDGIEVLSEDTIAQLGGGSRPVRLWEITLHGEKEINAARAAGTLAGALSYDGNLVYISTSGPSARRTREQERQEQRQREEAAREKARRDSITARIRVARTIAQSKINATDLATELAVALLRSADAATLKLAMRMLDSPAARTAYYDWRRQIIAGDRGALITAARAVALAAQELRAHEQWHGWGAAEVAYIGRLVAAGYAEGPYEHYKRENMATEHDEAPLGGADLDDRPDTEDSDQ